MNENTHRALFFTLLLLFVCSLPLYYRIKPVDAPPVVASPYDFTSAGEEAESTDGHIWILKDGNWYDVQRVRKPDGTTFVWKVDKEQPWRSTWVKENTNE